jgi:hypothetical protein
MSEMNGSVFGIVSTSIIHPDEMVSLHDQMLEIMNLALLYEEEM